jgi:hypothetical protein
MITTRPLIAFCGYKGSGKDTAAEVLLDLYDYKRVAFADPIRMIGREIFGFTDEEMSDRILKEKEVDRWPYQSPRKNAQLVGTEMFRSFYPDVWIQCADRFVEHAYEQGCGAVITDLRFPNEETYVRSKGGLIIRIHRVGVGQTDPHPSEAHISQIVPHFEIVNDSPSANAFKAKVIDFIHNLKKETV